jgi:hypothetical protein
VGAGLGVADELGVGLGVGLGELDGVAAATAVPPTSAAAVSVASVKEIRARRCGAGIEVLLGPSEPARTRTSLTSMS